MSAEQDAIKKMERCLMRWFTEDPMMLGAWTLVNKIADPNQHTLGIDSKTSPVTIRYNPNFINVLPPELLEHVMASEGFKILLRHPTTRHKDPKYISSLASTVTVNEVANKNISDLLDLDSNLPTAKKFGLKPQQYFEEYFRNLMEMADDAAKQLQQMFGQNPQQQQQPQQGQGNGSGQGEGDPNGQPQQGQGSGDQEQDQQNGGQGGGFKEFNNPGQAIKDYMNPMGTNSQDWGKNELFDAEVNNMINEKKTSAKEWGKYTNNALSSIIAANTPKLDYKTILRRFNNSVISQKVFSSRMKVNRRYDLAAPGHRRVYKSKVIFAIDVSGSMSDGELAEAFAIVNNVCRHSQLEYIQFDTEIKLKEKKFKKAKKEFKVCGRGGTDFQQIIDYATENKTDGLIIFTDGAAPAPTEPRGTKVLWLLTTPEARPPVKWGMVAHLRE